MEDGQLGFVKEAVDDDRQATERTLGYMLTQKFSRWETARQPTEGKWLNFLRSYHSKYAPGYLELRNETDGLAQKSEAFVGLSRTKAMAAYSRLVELEFPGGKKRNWAITPTPEPMMAYPPDAFLPQEFLEQLKQMPPQEANDLLVKEIGKVAADRAARMTTTIDDQLVEQQYDISSRAADLEACIFGSGCIKGPVVYTKKAKRWQVGAEGYWMQIEMREEPKPRVEYVSILDIYSDPDADSVDDCSGIFQRHLMTKRQLRDLRQYEGFDPTDTLIRQIIHNNPTGNHARSSLDLERRNIADTDASQSSGRYEVLEYWGTVDGYDLQAAGVDIAEDEVDIDHQANVWLCDGEAIRVTLNRNVPNVLPYLIFPFEKSPNQLLGTGPIEMMDDSQTIINAAARALEDNLEACKGPVIEFNADLIDPKTPIQKAIKAWKLYVRTGGDATAPLLRVYKIDPVIDECLAVINIFRRFVDDETSLPSYTHGEGMPAGTGVTRTASGMSMLMGAANIILKSVVKNIDDYKIRPLIQRMYDFNMKWNPDESIKGDMKIEAKGVASLLAKEIELQALISFLQVTANPLDAPLVNRPNTLKSIADKMGLNPDENIRTPQEIQEQQQAEQEAPENQLQLASLQINIEEAMSRIALNQAKAQQLLEIEGVDEAERRLGLEKILAEIQQMQARAEQARVMAYSKGVKIGQDQQRISLQAMQQMAGGGAQ